MVPGNVHNSKRSAAFNLTMHCPFFSVIIPTYNSEKTIRECLNSILEQSYPEFEVLIMDGASKDGTLNIVRSLDDSRIRVYSERDKGIYDAMNKGIRLAKGEYLLFLGSDDALYSSDTLGHVISGLGDYDIVYGNVYSTRFDGLYDGKFSETKIAVRNICHQSIFYKKTVFDVVGNFNLKYKSNADYDHNLRWFFSERIKHRFIDITITNYADGGFSSTYTDINFANIKWWKYNLMRKKQIKFSEKLQIIRSELREAIENKKRRKLITIIFQIPYFLL